jgi:hypothetical protein
MMTWIDSHPTLVGWLFALSATVFVGGLILMPILVVRMRSGYFVEPEPPPESWRDRHRALRFTLLIVRNALGVLLLLAGVAMLFLPGQGIITILAAISLLRFPGKRRLELWIVRRGPVLQAINWMRAKAGRPPLIVPER